MCGIFGYVGSEDAIGNLIFSGLKHLEYRGYDSWGIALSVDGGVHLSKTIGKLPKIPPLLPKAASGIGHTRWATTGAVTEANAHPHLAADGRLAIVHNGVVENFEEVQNTVLAPNISPLSETDSELIGLLVARHLENHNSCLLEAVLHASSQIEGLNAFAVLDTETDTLVATKTGSPLYLGKTEKAVLVASDLGSLLPLTQDIYRVGEFESVVLKGGEAEVVLDGKTSRPNYIRYAHEKVESELGTFSSHTRKEIAEQVSVLETYCRRDLRNEQHSFREILQQADFIWLTGCGTAYHAACIGAQFLNEAGLRAKAVYAHEWRHWARDVRSNDCMIAISQSGETIDVLDAVRETLKANSKVLALVNVRHSTLALLTPFVHFLDAGREHSVLSTKAFLAQVASLCALADPNGANLMLQRCRLSVDHATQSPTLANIEYLAKSLLQQEHLFLLGAGAMYTVAMEGALKIKEVSYLHAEAIPNGELKHGTLALITEGIPVISIIPDDDFKPHAFTCAREVKARGGRIIGISSEDSEVFTDHIVVQGSGCDFLMGATVVLQQLGVCLAELKGFDPDKPRNLAKSVTVR